MTSFAENDFQYEDGQPNVIEPPETLMLNGWIPKRQGANGQPIVAQYLNWLFREIFRRLNLSSLHDGLGANTIAGHTDSHIVLYAISKTDPTIFLHAQGYKVGNNVPIFRVLNSGTLTLGSITADSTPINGASSSSIVLKVIVSEFQ